MKRQRPENFEMKVIKVKVSFANDEAANIKMIVQDMILNAYWSRVLSRQI